MNEFCKILKYNDCQLLVVKQFNNETESDEIELQLDATVARLKATLSFNSEEGMDKFYDTLNNPEFLEAKIDEFFGGILKRVNG